MKQTEALKGLYDDLSKPKATTIVQQADKFFETQAQFNKWLKELTEAEVEHVKDMLVMFCEEVKSTEPNHQS